MGVTYLQGPNFIPSFLLNQYISISLAGVTVEKSKERKINLFPITFTDTPFPQSIWC